MRKRTPIADYDRRYDTVRAIFTVTCDQTGRGVRVGHMLTPQPRGTVEARKTMARRVAGVLLDAVGLSPINVSGLRRLLNNSITADLLATIREQGKDSLRRTISPDDELIAGHFEKIYQPALTGKPEWRIRQLWMMKKNVFPIRPPGRTKNIGELHPKDLVESDCRTVKVRVNDLDLSNKYRVEIYRTWSDYVSALRTHDDTRIRLRDGMEDPLAHVEPIKKTARGERQYLSISEAWQLLGADKVDRELQRFFATQMLLGLRVSEVKGLQAGDIRRDLIRVTRKIIWSETESAWKTEDFTKSKSVRWVKIPTNYRPLLDALVKRCPEGSLFPGLVTERKMAAVLRDCLKAAGVTRSELHHAHTGSAHITSHDLRATCATWLYQLGWDLNEVKRQLGHADTATTETYIRERVSLDGEEVNPLEKPLPARLFEGLERFRQPSRQSSGETDAT